jgi:hypothetical protein
VCLDKGYDFPEIERESTKRRCISHIFVTDVKRKIDKNRISNKRMGL